MSSGPTSGPINAAFGQAAPQTIPGIPSPPGVGVAPPAISTPTQGPTIDPSGGLIQSLPGRMSGSGPGTIEQLLAQGAAAIQQQQPQAPQPMGFGPSFGGGRFGGLLG